MPFISMVIFMVKLAFASIPALIIATLIFVVLGSFFSGILHHAIRGF